MDDVDFLVVTGSRSEWFILEPLVDELLKDFSLKVVVTGSHLSRRINTVEFITSKLPSDSVVKLHAYIDSDELVGRAKTVVMEIAGFVEMFYRLNPGGVIVLGDREETIAAGVAANYLNVPLVHLAGGERVVGNVDDTVRHAVTKLAHLHFPFTKYAYRRIIQMGEEKWRVTLSGSPSLDGIKKIPEAAKEEVLNKLNLGFVSRYAVVIYHPISSAHGKAAEEFRSLLDILLKVRDLFYVVIKPNMDPGSEGILRAAERFASSFPERFALLDTLPREIFVNLLRNAEMLIGNSSLGIHEAPFLNLPVVNVLPRQQGRDHSENVVFVNLNEMEITSVVEKILSDSDFRERLKNAESIYGDGNAIPKIIGKLKEFDWRSEKDRLRLINKDFVDLEVV